MLQGLGDKGKGSRHEKDEVGDDGPDPLGQRRSIF